MTNIFTLGYWHSVGYGITHTTHSIKQFYVCKENILRKTFFFLLFLSLFVGYFDINFRFKYLGIILTSVHTTFNVKNQYYVYQHNLLLKYSNLLSTPPSPIRVILELFYLYRITFWLECNVFTCCSYILP